MGGAIVSLPGIRRWLEELSREYPVFAPVTGKRGETVFERIEDAGSLDFEYRTTMVSPRSFIYPSRQELFSIDRADSEAHAVIKRDRRVIFGIHPCDLHAIRVLDKTFLGKHKDLYYRKAREDNLTIVLNCNQACEKKYPLFTFRGFCASMKTGPFLRLSEGYDVELTRLSPGEALVEAGSKRGGELMAKAKALRDAAPEDLGKKKELEGRSMSSFKKSLDIEGLPELLARNTEHPIYKLTAQSRCLNCTNCTMVCPTCYCYDIEDSTSFDLETAGRRRHWDSCQELGFAKWDHGNLRPSRGARLRQFVTHKLGTWVEQFGCLGCIGCGRCMLWCPTHIDLTAIALAIRKSAQRKAAVK
jgi:ferredoxin